LGASSSVKTKGYEIGIYCFSAEHTALRNKRKDCWTQNQDYVLKME